MSQLDYRTGKIVISSPDMLGDHSNMLLNDRYVVRVGETLQGTSKVLVPQFRPRNITNGKRQFFIRFEDGTTWNVNQDMTRHEDATFIVTHSLHQTALETVFKGLKVTIHVFVPQDATAEVWTVDIRNTSHETFTFSLFSAFGFEHGGIMESSAAYDSDLKTIVSHTFPYHVFYDDKAWLERTVPASVFLHTDKTPESHGTSWRRFMGTNRGHGIPEGVKNDRCDNAPTTAPDTTGILHHRFTLGSGARTHVHLVLGAAYPDRPMKDQIGSWNDASVEAARLGAKRFTEHLKDTLFVETPDKSFDHKFNGWFKKQLYNMSANNRMSAHYPIRNVLQDAMGYALIDPAHALSKLKEVLSTQSGDGSVRQWQHFKGTGPNGLARLDHSDGPVWIVLAGVAIIEQVGDAQAFDQLVTYGGDTQGTIRDHFLRAIIHMAGSVGPHGLILMKDGDWTDPVNGVGRRGIGESTWNTLATLVAIDRLLPHLSDPADVGLMSRLKERLKTAVRQHAIRPTHIIAGYDDDGVPFGDDNCVHGKRYLNVHTWALMTDVLSDVEREVVKDVIQALDTPLGPRLLDPPYMDYSPQVGRISLKKPGTTENGSIYNHAVMFKAYAESLSGDPDAALSTIMAIMPDNPMNPNRHLQLPSYVPNYVYSIEDSPDFGRSSLHDSTGTTAWIYWVMVESVFGVKAGVKGLEILDIPATRWKTVRLSRQYKGTTYNILIRHGDAFSVTVDGIPSQSPVLPYQKTTCHVVVERRVI